MWGTDVKVMASLKKRIVYILSGSIISQLVFGALYYLRLESILRSFGSPTALPLNEIEQLYETMTSAGYFALILTIGSAINLLMTLAFFVVRDK